MRVGKATRPHQMHAEPGKVQVWRCAICCRKATSLKAKQRLEGKQCTGHLLAATVANTPAGQVRVRNHKLLQTGPLVWRRLCGGHTQGQKADKLLKPCNQRPTNNWSRSVLNRMLNGKHPKTGTQLEFPTTSAATTSVALSYG